MLRNSIGFVAGVLLSYVLIIGGARLAWLLIVGNVDSTDNKDAIVSIMLWQTLVVVPAVSVIVGGFVASIVTRSGWWLGGLATLPLFIHGFVSGVRSRELLLFAVYMGLAFATAFVVSRFKRTRTA